MRKLVICAAVLAAHVARASECIDVETGQATTCNKSKPKPPDPTCADDCARRYALRDEDCGRTTSVDACEECGQAAKARCAECVTVWCHYPASAIAARCADPYPPLCSGLICVGACASKVRCGALASREACTDCIAAARAGCLSCAATSQCKAAPQAVTSICGDASVCATKLTRACKSCVDGVDFASCGARATFEECRDCMGQTMADCNARCASQPACAGNSTSACLRGIAACERLPHRPPPPPPPKLRDGRTRDDP